MTTARLIASTNLDSLNNAALRARIGGVPCQPSFWVVEPLKQERLSSHRIDYTQSKDVIGDYSVQG